MIVEIANTRIDRDKISGVQNNGQSLLVLFDNGQKLSINVQYEAIRAALEKLMPLADQSETKPAEEC